MSRPADMREIRRQPRRRYAVEDTLRFIVVGIRDEGERDPRWTLEQISTAIARWHRAA